MLLRASNTNLQREKKRAPRKVALERGGGDQQRPKDRLSVDGPPDCSAAHGDVVAGEAASRILPEGAAGDQDTVNRVKADRSDGTSIRSYVMKCLECVSDTQNNELMHHNIVC